MSKFSIYFSLLLLLYATSACAEDISGTEVAGTSMPYYGTRMKLSFLFDDVAPTPSCKPSDKDFPLKQSDAINKALKWASVEFDGSKKWRVREVSLRFVEVGMGDYRCVYTVELMPDKDMQSLPVGILMDGSLVAPVSEK